MPWLVGGIRQAQAYRDRQAEPPPPGKGQRWGRSGGVTAANGGKGQQGSGVVAATKCLSHKAGKVGKCSPVHHHHPSIHMRHRQEKTQRHREEQVVSIRWREGGSWEFQGEGEHSRVVLQGGRKGGGRGAEGQPTACLPPPPAAVKLGMEGWHRQHAT